MGYNAHLMRAGSIPARKEPAGTAICQIITAAIDQRITIPYLRLRTGAAGGELAVLQTEAVYRFVQVQAGNTITVPGIPANLTNRKLVIRTQNGEILKCTVQTQTGETVTLDTSVPVNSLALLYLLGTDESPNTFRIPLSANASTVLQADCPGVITAREMGWPIGVFLENTDGNAEIEGGTIAFIGV